MADLEKDLERLRELGLAAHELRYSSDPEADKVRLARDKLIGKLATEGVSKTVIARAANVHRTFIYRVKDNYAARQRRWKAQQKK